MPFILFSLVYGQAQCMSAYTCTCTLNIRPRKKKIHNFSGFIIFLNSMRDAPFFWTHPLNWTFDVQSSIEVFHAEVHAE